MRLPRLRFTVGWVMASSPFLICGCFALMLLALGGLVFILHLFRLDGLILPVYGIGILAVVPLGFLMSVRIGRLLLDEGVRQRKR
jgi:hypothetical protein